MQNPFKEFNRNKFESKPSEHGAAIEPHAKLQVKGLNVDQIYPYIAASPDLLITCHCCGN